MILKKSLIYLVALIISISLSAQQRKEIHIPDIPGYLTLKCDFHMHTVFSDGTVWPTVRVEEAWQEGLDAISITEHLEWRPHSTDIIADHNRAYEIALPVAERSGIILIKGAEITRGLPPGHLNTLFIKDANLLRIKNVNDALREARDQGAFIIWNHPRHGQRDTTLWWEEHTYLLNNDLLHGIEVCNGYNFYPEALAWANEKNLTMFGNTDIHGPIQMNYDMATTHRPMTLVFASEKTETSIKEALLNKRTVVYSENNLYGKPELLKSLFFESIQSSNKRLVHVKKKDLFIFLITNNSDIEYLLELAQPSVGFDCPEKISLKAHHSVLVELTGISEEVAQLKTLDIHYFVRNMFISPDENLNISLKIKN